MQYYDEIPKVSIFIHVIAAYFSDLFGYSTDFFTISEQNTKLIMPEETSYTYPHQYRWMSLKSLQSLSKIFLKVYNYHRPPL